VAETSSYENSCPTQRAADLAVALLFELVLNESISPFLELVLSPNR